MGNQSNAVPDSAGRADRGRSTQLLVVIVVAILVLGGLSAALVLQKRRADDLEARLDEAEQRVVNLAAGMADGSAEVEDPDDPPTADEDAEDPGEDPDPEPAADSDDGTFIGLITDIYNEGSTRFIEIDYIQFLTGDEAADAAAARGDESPPPNDYYIVNENPRLRDLRVESGLHVTMWTWDMLNSGVREDSILFDIWWDEIEMHMRDELLSNPYWIEVTDGIVTSIEEQYLP